MKLIPSKLAQQYAIYGLTDSAGTVVFLGMIRMAQLFTLSDARRHPRFDITKEYSLAIYAAVDTYHDAINTRSDIMRGMGYMPDLNRDYYSITPRGRIYCDQTREIFRTQTECANAHGLNLGALNRHLMRAKGYKSVKGKTYSYIDTNAAGGPGGGATGAQETAAGRTEADQGVTVRAGDTVQHPDGRAYRLQNAGGEVVLVGPGGGAGGQGPSTYQGYGGTPAPDFANDFGR